MNIHQASVIIFAIFVTTSATGRDLSVASLASGYEPNPYQSIDRLPDKYIDGKPYWAPQPRTAPAVRRPAATKKVERDQQPRSAPVAPLSTTAEQQVPATAAMAAELPVADRLPDQYIDGRPYWAPTPAILPAPVISPWEAEFGGRYFYSTARTQIELFGNRPGITNQLNSRLTYKDLVAHSGEVFGRVDHATGFFVKGFIGGGAIPGGTLQDEDFPPAIFPYSSTNSDQRDGRLLYGAIDFGWAWRMSDFKASFFAGYFHSSESLHAFGCTQTAANPICLVDPPPLSTWVEIIRQDTQWHALRLGVNTEWKMTDRWKLTTEVAWLPYVNINAQDTHLQRIGINLSGPGPEKGADVASIQVEAMLSFALTEALSVGVGGRYWNIAPQRGNTTITFPDIIEPVDLAGTLRTERWGAYFQAGYKFGQLPPSNFTDSGRRF